MSLFAVHLPFPSFRVEFCVPGLWTFYAGLARPQNLCVCVTCHCVDRTCGVSSCWTCHVYFVIKRKKCFCATAIKNFSFACCRFINARRRIVQPMIDQSNRAGKWHFHYCYLVYLVICLSIWSRFCLSSGLLLLLLFGFMFHFFLLVDLFESLVQPVRFRFLLWLLSRFSRLLVT